MGAHALAPRLGEKTVTWSLASNYAIFNGSALVLPLELEEGS